MKTIHTTQAPEAVGPYSQGIVSGDLFYGSGQIPLTPAGAMVEGGIREQAKQVLENVRAVLAEAGASFESVIKTTVFIVDMAEFGEVNEVYGSYFATHQPARSCIQVAGLPKGARVEVEVIAELN